MSCTDPECPCSDHAPRRYKAYRPRCINARCRNSPGEDGHPYIIVTVDGDAACSQACIDAFHRQMSIDLAL